MTLYYIIIVLYANTLEDLDARRRVVRIYIIFYRIKIINCTRGGVMRAAIVWCVPVGATSGSTVNVCFGSTRLFIGPRPKLGPPTVGAKHVIRRSGVRIPPTPQMSTFTQRTSPRRRLVARSRLSRACVQVLAPPPPTSPRCRRRRRRRVIAPTCTPYDRHLCARRLQKTTVVAYVPTARPVQHRDCYNYFIVTICNTQVIILFCFLVTLVCRLRDRSVVEHRRLRRCTLREH